MDKFDTRITAGRKITAAFVYWCLLSKDEDGGFVVTFPDFPEAVTQGDDLAEVILAAEDCLDEAIAWRIKARESIPLPGKKPRGRAVPVAPGSLMQAKATLWTLMNSQEVSPTQLAKLMGRPRQDVTRLLSPRHGTNHRHLDEAFRALNRRLVLQAA
jgi:antitoxin HicB